PVCGHGAVVHSGGRDHARRRDRSHEMNPDPRPIRAADTAAFLCLSIAVARAQTADSTAAAPPATTPAPVANASLLQKGVTGELLALNVPRSEMELQRLVE